MTDINDINYIHHDDLDAEIRYHAADVPPRPAAAEALVEAAFDAAMLPEIGLLLENRGYVIVLRVPEPDWIGPVRRIVREILPDADVIGARERYAGGSNEEVCAALAAGREIVGIAADPDKLPGALTRTADGSVVLHLPVGEALRPVIAAVTGRPCPPVPADLGSGLGLAEAAAAIRPHDEPQAAIARLARAQAAIGGLDALADAPPLDALHGYGAAMDWALDLADDVAAYRAGKIPWSRVRAAGLLASEPGLGKTTFVRSLARSLGAPLVATSVADWFQKGDSHLGSVLKSARDSHATASRLAQAGGLAIWFADEIDALPDRATMDDRAREWWSPVVNNVLKLLDDRPPGLIVVGATNHPDRLDAALVRPGRLSPTLVIQPPDADAVAGILRVHLGSELAGADLTVLGPLGAGRTGAALAGIVAKAQAEARRDVRPLRLEDLVQAMAPPERRSAVVLERVAVHEAGHAVVALLLGMRLERVTILASGMAGGSTLASMDDHLMTRRELEARVLMTLAGRAAEEVLLGDVSAGAALDLRQATELVAGAHLAFGLGGRLTAVGAELGHALAIDAVLAAAVESELQTLYARAATMIGGAREGVRRVAEALLARRLLSGSDVSALLGPSMKSAPRRMGTAMPRRARGGRHAAK